ncbi:hypothetical protein [Saccharothrix coeruleofusca]|uniref:hypothetical protein n=1 Tax=Saccharothrix coeruleofusca TaxID=33919 RepID=UPI00166FE4EB|nr:hypothetical protein [Saccharothrix coeruleofusca]MBP2336019.1 hypothetical protein [Saccharothrix coeruleofusca]
MIDSTWSRPAPCTAAPAPRTRRPGGTGSGRPPAGPRRGRRDGRVGPRRGAAG